MDCATPPTASRAPEPCRLAGTFPHALVAAGSAPQRPVTAEPTPAVGKRSAARRVFAETGLHGVFTPSRRPRGGRHLARPSFWLFLTTCTGRANISVAPIVVSTM